MRVTYGLFHHRDAGLCRDQYSLHIFEPLDVNFYSPVDKFLMSLADESDTLV